MANLSSFYPQPVVAGTTEGTFAEGNDARIVGALPAATAGTGSVLASGSTTARTLSNRFADAVNVKDFGAVGNNSADDGPAIRAAVAYGVANNKAVYFPKGTYLISTTTTGASSIPSGSGYAVQVTNTSTTVAQNVILLGDDATIVSPLYPQEYSGPPYEQFVFFDINGYFDEIFVSGLNVVSTSPVANIQSSVNPSVKSDKGRVYGFYIKGQGANYWSETIRPRNLIARNCSFRDCLIGMRVDNAENFTADNCSFFYTYGYAIVGTSDWAVGLGTRLIRNLKVVNCFFDGHTAPVNSTLSQFYGYNAKAADGLVLCAGGASNTTTTYIITNNHVRNFAREGIYVFGDSGAPHTESSHAEIGATITNNILDGRYPTGHVPTVNWGIRLDAANSIVSNNVCYKCHTGILQAGNTSYGGSGSAHFTRISNNSILLADADKAGYIGATGISTNGNYVTIEGNTIIGKNIGIYRQNGWDGTTPQTTYTVSSTDQANNTITVTGHPYNDGDVIYFSAVPSESGVNAGSGSQYFVINKNGNTFSLATSFYHDPVTLAVTGTPVNITADLSGRVIQGGRLDNVSAIEIFGPPNVNANNARVFVRNNIMRIVSKKNDAVLSYAIQPDANNCEVIVENNIIDGFDYAFHRYGGGSLPVIIKDNTIIGAKRLTTGYAFNEFFGLPYVQRHSFTIYPTQTGWYEIPLTQRYSGELNLDIKTLGEFLYGDTTAITENGGQSTSLSVAWYDEVSGNGNSNTRLFMSQKHVGTFPAVTEAYGRIANATPLLYIYVNRVLSKAALSFSGGGGSGAVGHAVISGGVVQSVTMTNNGSGYTSAPTVSIANTSKFARDIVGSGATFTAVLSGNTVGSVTVGGSGGSGYAQPIEILVKSEQGRFGVGILHPRYTATTPSSGMKMIFSAGSKNMLQSGGGSGVITGTGDPITSTSAPSSIPEFIGQQYINTVSGIVYIGTGTSSSSDWKALATWNP